MADARKTNNLHGGLLCHQQLAAIAVSRTNIPAENAYNALTASVNNIALRQLRLSTETHQFRQQTMFSGYITSRALQARNGALKAALNSAGDAKNVTSIAQDALDQIYSLMAQIKDATATYCFVGALGTDEKVALAKGAYRLAQQIQFITDSLCSAASNCFQATLQANGLPLLCK
jgi:flagellin-like hook-associated protein FlgL